MGTRSVSPGQLLGGEVFAWMEGLIRPEVLEESSVFSAPAQSGDVRPFGSGLEPESTGSGRQRGPDAC